MKKTFVIAFLVVFASLQVNGQVEDSLQTNNNTPFKKGLWLTSLDGSLSSSNNAVAQSVSNNYNTAYGLNIASNKLIRDRFAVGLRLAATRAASSGILDRESESIFLGPSATYFFSPAENGSLFLAFAPGYVRFFEASAANSGNIFVSEIVDGNGFGTMFNFGYAHSINKSVLFSFGMSLTNFWILADRTSEPLGTTFTENITIGSIAFNFGFGVLLEKFFF